NAQPEGPHPRLPLLVGLVDTAADQIIDADGKRNKEQSRQLAPRVEKKAGDEQNEIPETARNQVIDNKKNRQKSEKKYARRKKHRALLKNLTRAVSIRATVL